MSWITVVWSINAGICMTLAGLQVLVWAKLRDAWANLLFAMSGMRNPYTEGPLGVVKEGTYADLLLVDGNPLEDLSAVTNSEHIKIIMKDGKTYKNTL